MKWEEGDGWCAECDAVHTLKAGGEGVEFGGDCFGEHVGVEEGGYGAAGTVAGDEERARGTVGVFLEEVAEAGGDGTEHSARDAEEAGVAEVAFVVEEVGGWYGRGGEVDVPVTEREDGGAADGEDNGFLIVDGHGFDDHGFGAQACVRGDVVLFRGGCGGAEVGGGGVGGS